MAGERGIGRGDVVARLPRQRLGRVVLAPVRRPDRRRAGLNRLARGRDRHLAGAVLLLEGLAGAGADGADLRAPIHRDRYDDALRRRDTRRSSGTRSSGM